MPNETSPLSEREKDVARILLQGKSNKQIALELGISSRTVEFHLKNIYTKLGVSSRTEAILKLTEGDLWKTTGGIPVESTVGKTGDPAENDTNVISWRIPMQKTFYIVGGILLTILIVTLIVLDITPRSLETSPTPTVHVEIPTATVLVPTQTTEPETEPERFVIPPHTVNGYTASIESYYIDISHVIFQMRLTTDDPDVEFDSSRLGYLDLYDEHGNLINTSGAMGPAKDPELVEFHFVPVSFFTGDRLKGQLTFNLYGSAPDHEKIEAKFSFDLDLPIYPEVRFFPRQTVTANGLDILVDSITVTPVFTQVYLCYQPPSDAPWTVGNATVLEIAGHEAPIYNSTGLFSSFTGSYLGTHSEPYWVPPVKNGACDKIGFNVGASDPASLTLTIPDLENPLPYLQSPIDLDALYPGLSKRRAYHTYLDENGFTHKGPWVFHIELVP